MQCNTVSHRGSSQVIGKFSIRVVPTMNPDKVVDQVRAHVAAEWAKLNTPNTYEVLWLSR